jgi:hypothetical protein
MMFESIRILMAPSASRCCVGHVLEIPRVSHIL